MDKSGVWQVACCASSLHKHQVNQIETLRSENNALAEQIKSLTQSGSQPPKPGFSDATARLGGAGANIMVPGRVAEVCVLDVHPCVCVCVKNHETRGTKMGRVVSLTRSMGCCRRRQTRPAALASSTTSSTPPATPTSGGSLRA